MDCQPKTEVHYFKITNKLENHHGFQYVDGLNVLKEPFNEVDSCCPGGLYFTDAKNILYFINFGVWLRDISLPTNDPTFKMVADPSGGKWRANQLILGKRYPLYELETFLYLENCGADFLNMPWDNFRILLQMEKYSVIHFILHKYHLDNIESIFKYLAPCGYGGYIENLKKLMTDPESCKDINFIITACDPEMIKRNIEKNGLNINEISVLTKNIIIKKCNLELTKYFEEKGVIFDQIDQSTIDEVVSNQNLVYLKYLLEKNINIGRISQTAIDCVVDHKNRTYLEFLIKNGVDIKKISQPTLNFVTTNSEPSYLEFLMNNGIDITKIDRLTTEQIAQRCDLEYVKFLVGKGVNFTVIRDFAIDYILKQGSLDYIKFLANHGVNFIRVSVDVLNTFIIKDRFDVLEYLIANRLTLSHISDRYLNLMSQSSNCKISMVKFLISCGAQINQIYPSTMVKALSNNIKLFKLLAENGAPIPRLNLNECANLVIHSKPSDLKIMLETYLIDPSDINYEKIVQFSQNATGTIQVIVDFMVVPNKNIYNRILRASCKFGNPELVKYIVQKGADVHSANDFPVRWASKKGDLDTVKFLVENGADFRAENNYASKWATQNGFLNVVSYLNSI